MTDEQSLNPESWLDEHGDFLYRFALFEKARERMRAAIKAKGV